MKQPASIPRLNALTLAEIQKWTAKYHANGDTEAWERSIQKTLAKAHQAAYMLGAAERLKVPINSPLLNARNLSRYERDQLKSIVSTQLDFLSRFVDVSGGLSPEAIDVRADLYALAPKQTYWTGWSGQELECVPGGCEECFGNCRCSLRRETNGIHWDCADDSHSCDSCRQRGSMSPYAKEETDAID